jgi:hypothetical protein
MNLPLLIAASLMDGSGESPKQFLKRSGITRAIAPIMPGTEISHGTVNPEHLLVRYIEVLKEHWPDVWRSLERDEDLLRLYTLAKDGADLAEDDYAQIDQYVFEDLQQTFDALCPLFAYFGASEGDGSSIGFWLAADYIEDSIENGFIIDLSPYSTEARHFSLGQVPPNWAHGGSHYVLIKGVNARDDWGLYTANNAKMLWIAPAP